MPPSRHDTAIDERLDALVMKNLAKSPAEPFDGAAGKAWSRTTYYVLKWALLAGLFYCCSSELGE